MGLNYVHIAIAIIAVGAIVGVLKLVRRGKS